MHDSTDFLKIIKKTAVDAVNTAKPTDITLGTVISENPLQIQISQKIVLGTAQIMLTRNVTDYTMKIQGKNIQSFYYAGDTPTPVSPSHTHAVGEIEINVKNSLKIGEKVVMLMASGGQKYVVLDRTVG